MNVKRDGHQFLKISLMASAIGCLTIIHLRADPTPIINPSFEVPVLADGAFTLDPTPVPGWSNLGGGARGVHNPAATVFPNGGLDGENYLYTTPINDPTGSGVRQSVGPLDASSRYTLTVRVGERNDYLSASLPPPTNIVLRLYYSTDVGTTGNVFPTPVTQSSPALVQGAFVTWSRAYEIPANGIVDGTNVFIEIFSQGDGNWRGAFDLVALDFVPEPTSGVLLSLAGLGAWLLRRRRS